MSDINSCFTSEVGATINGVWTVVGTVNSTYLTDSYGNFIRNPAGQPYIVPLGYNPQDTVDRFVSFDSTNDVYSNLVGYKTGGEYDLQRSFDGNFFWKGQSSDGEPIYGSVKDYTPIASFDFGLAASSGAVNLATAEYFGGAINLKNVVSTIERNLGITLTNAITPGDQNLLSDDNQHTIHIPNFFGIFLNNINNPPNIEAGYSYYINDSLPFLDILLEQVKDDINWLLGQNFDQLVNELIDIGIEIGDYLTQINELFNPFASLGQAINDFYNAAQNWLQPRVDPLTLDLDGDGLETIGFTAANPIYFDHDLNGIKEGTGWVMSDDGFLVLDRNGNGRIDNGAKLFGDHTASAGGGYAADGFAALAQEDTNQDGKVDASDARFAELRVWRDLNQNGLSEANELFTLNSLGIAAINVASTHNSQILTNGNQIANLGSYTKTDGSTGITGVVADINLVANTFHRQFTDHLDTSTVAYLPDMRGSGQVRDLREAASLSGTLASTLANFSTQTTRAGQQARLDTLITDWADSSAMMTGVEKADDHGYPLIYLIPGQTASSYDAFLDYCKWNGLDADDSASFGSLPFSDSTRQQMEQCKTQQLAITRLIGILERFNGETFVNITSDSVSTGAGQVLAVSSTASTGSVFTIASTPRVYVTLSVAQIDLLNNSFNALKDSVYGSLIMQTRLKPYLDSINLTITTDGIALDFSGLNALLNSHKQFDAENAFIDLLELQKYVGDKLNPNGWDGVDQIVHRVKELPESINVNTLLTEFGYHTSTAGNDILIGANDADNFNGQGGNDRFFGGGGNDTLTGHGSFEGGLGDDTLIASSASYHYYSGDTYVFNIGDGKDTIIEYGSNDAVYVDNYASRDVLKFGTGIAPAAVTLAHSGNDIIFKISSTDQVTVKDWFVNSERYIEEVQFADGTVWNISQMQTLILDIYYGTAAAETINGWDGIDNINGLAGDDIINTFGGNDIINGADGNDTLNAGDGDDQLLGGAGADVINGDNGNDRLEGGDGNDTLTDTSGYNIFKGGRGNDTLTGHGSFEGSLGNDTLIASSASYHYYSGDTYVFNIGDGKDTIIEYGSNDAVYVDNYASRDVLQFGAGIAPVAMPPIRNGNDMIFKVSNTDQVTVKDWFVNSERYIEEIQFANGTVWTVNTLLSMEMQLIGTNAGDTLTGWDGIDNINGLAGDDTINTFGGNDRIDGGDGNDTLNAGDGDDQLLGGSGADVINGDNGDDRLEGGDGNDTLTDTSGYNTFKGGRGNDTLTGHGSFEGGLGDDTLIASSASYHYYSGDTYVFNIGDGKDTIIEYGSNDAVYVDNYASRDVLKFGTGIAPAAVTLAHSGNDIIFKISSTDQVTVKDWFVTSERYIEEIQFANGMVWTVNTLLGIETQLIGTNAGDTLTGWAGKDNIDSGAGSDVINGGAGDDTLDGGVSDVRVVGMIDTLNGDAGNDTFLARGFFGAGNYNGGADIDWLDFSQPDTYTAGRRSAEGAGVKVDLATGTASTYYLKASNFTWTDTQGQIALTGIENVRGTAQSDILSGDGYANVLEGGSGSDILTGGAGKDFYLLQESVAATDTLKIATGDSLVASFDVVSHFKSGVGITTAGVDKLDLVSTLIAANMTTVDGVDSGTLQSHRINKGMISFDDVNNYTTPITLTESDLPGVFGYLQTNITGNKTVAFVSEGNTFVFQDGGVTDTLVELVGVTASSISTTGLAANSVWIA